MPCRRVPGPTRPPAGFTLIELMVAMLLGLIVIAGVASVFLANQRTYRTNQALGDVQDGSRIAFELLARDIRNAGLNPCNNGDRMGNVLNNSGTDWWANWSNAVHGYSGSQGDPATGGVFGTGVGQRVAGTDSMQVLGAVDGGMSVATDNEPAANFKLNDKTTNLQSGDIVIVCDPDHAVLVQISNYNNSNVTFVHNTGNAVNPGNCSKGLGYPSDCSSTNGNLYQFGANSQIAKLGAADWYVGNNPVGGRSLYRVALAAPDAKENVSLGTPQEMVRNVNGMVINYHARGGTAFVTASSIGNWAVVDAAQITLTLQSADQRAGTDTRPLVRSFTATTTVRNRVN
ncbi:prepilin-type N-terminal cleavage/methylation domain-containing protein [Rhodanobacter denitrificans]|uniref:Prepilin-type N-terminal cleavage/methylation domain-containing protein n=1 Tax=Rhodanobacter denitrificans TaxID=666685 RepID=A0A368KH69_9GAMM|nr:prepilin-type N-terminal cleavage/methylation domain-containing protein [Rhodanobacter denitrificans]RCS31264.1 prepilin-type N-terminal cleavage/methylation domain-containing protein [Rhodanobacter denitrificans]